VRDASHYDGLATERVSAAITTNDDDEMNGVSERESALQANEGEDVERNNTLSPGT
jgi:hypothetical protein